MSSPEPRSRKQQVCYYCKGLIEIGDPVRQVMEHHCFYPAHPACRTNNINKGHRSPFNIPRNQVKN